jgi:hypothetical protein
MPVKIVLLVIVLLLPMAPTFWAILDIPKRRFSSTKKKVLWFFVVATLPFLGAILYLTFVRRHTHPLEIS